jgi:hypothetical protein
VIWQNAVRWPAFFVALLACDPVHQSAVDALGDEAPGVRRGPTHRPGQPCMLCHDGALGDASQFTVAGTVYADEGQNSGGANSVQVVLTDSTGSTFTTTTNTAGNFYLTPRDWTPTYPMKVKIVATDGSEHPMTTHVGRDGSCAGCHEYPPGPRSPGHVYLSDGGLP